MSMFEVRDYFDDKRKMAVSKAVVYTDILHC